MDCDDALETSEKALVDSLLNELGELALDRLVELLVDWLEIDVELLVDCELGELLDDEFDDGLEAELGLVELLVDCELTLENDDGDELDDEDWELADDFEELVPALDAELFEDDDDDCDDWLVVDDELDDWLDSVEAELAELRDVELLVDWLERLDAEEAENPCDDLELDDDAEDWDDLDVEDEDELELDSPSEDNEESE